LDPKAKKTKTGQYATGEEILSKMANEHPIAEAILGLPSNGQVEVNLCGRFAYDD
jgi:hypothetical protein